MNDILLYGIKIRSQIIIFDKATSNFNYSNNITPFYSS